MSRKVMSLLAVLVMVFGSLAVILPDDSSAEATTPVTVHPVPGNTVPWVSIDPVPFYNGGNLYFTENPRDGLVDLANGDITLDELKASYGYSSSQPTSGPYYDVYIRSGNSSIFCDYFNNRNVEIIPPMHLYFAEDPYYDVVSYVQKQITLDELKTRSGWSETPSNYEVQYSEGNSSVNINGLAFHSIQVGIEYMDLGNLYFAQDPYSEVVKFVNKEITLQELKTKCGYSDEPIPDRWYYTVNYQNWSGRFFVSYHENWYVDSGQFAISGEAYFTENPYAEVVKYINGEIELTTLVAECGYTPKNSRVEGGSYYVVSISGNGGGNNTLAGYVKYIEVQPNYIFLQKGTYHISITDTDLTYIRVNGLNKNSRYDGIEIEERKGSADIEVKSNDAIWFTNNSDSWGEVPLDSTWREKVITYTFDPAPTPGQEVTTFESTIKILPDKEWVKATSVDALTGTFSLQNNYVMFIAGSDEESTFLEEVIDQGLMDGSGYGYAKLTLDGQKLVFYSCRETSSRMSNNIWLHQEDIEPYGQSVSVEIKSEKLSVSDVKPFKFYGKYDFSVSVKYDTSKVKAVVMMFPTAFGTTGYSVLESGILYEFHQVSAAEYELYAIPVTSASATLEPVEIQLHTENVASPDDNGMIFAGVAIALCAIAFGILFMSGRRPKWNESTGLPTGDVGAVQNAVPEETVEEAVAETATPEEPPKE